ncbi:hypothetical protein Drorol1_Dr00008281 [Drosera rotundifolia]
MFCQFFGGCTGYGHDEAGGREGLDQAFAEIFGAESAIVRSQFFSGTHVITCALFAILRPGDELLAVAGAPYDTKTQGRKEEEGNRAEKGVVYVQGGGGCSRRRCGGWVAAATGKEL